MISSPKRYLSAYFTLPTMSLLAKGSDAWKMVFPFTEPGGAWTFSGRVALFSGLRQIQLRAGSTVLVPSYFQGTEIDTLIAAGYKLRFYTIDDNFEVDLSDVEQKLDEDVSALFIIHSDARPLFAQRASAPRAPHPRRSRHRKKRQRPLCTAWLQ
jgi:hypothetical protein